MRDEKRNVMFAPRPARQRGDGEIRAEQNQPNVKPRRAINVGARHFRVEARFVNRARDCADDEHGEQHDRELDRREKFYDRIAQPGGSRCCCRRIGHLKIDIFRESGRGFKREGGSAAPSGDAGKTRLRRQDLASSKDCSIHLQLALKRAQMLREARGVEVIVRAHVFAQRVQLIVDSQWRAAICVQRFH